MLVIKGQSSAEKSVQNNSAGPQNKILKHFIIEIYETNKKAKKIKFNLETEKSCLC
jgi:hypothetical protein